MYSKGFRAWLGARLLGTRYATIRLSDHEIDAVAKRLGVDPDLLLEVRAQARLVMHEQGRSPALSNGKRAELNEIQKRIYQLRLWMPKEVQAAWYAECELRAVHPPTFLRALIHAYLLGTREPQPAKYWSWEGRLYTKYKADHTDVRTVIPNGAKRALWRRAATIGARPTDLVRALMLEALSGRHSGVQLVSSGMMYDDESRYNTGDTLPA